MDTGVGILLLRDVLVPAPLDGGLNLSEGVVGVVKLVPPFLLGVLALGGKLSAGVLGVRGLIVDR